jgi:hypothetical protein
MGIALCAAAPVVRKRASSGRLEEPWVARGECGPVPAASVPTQHDQTEDAGWLSEQTRPINLVDIGRVLGESAKAERLGDIPIRAWREDLTVIRDSLSYARAILAADVAVLTEPASLSPAEPQEIIDGLPGVLTAPPPEPQWPETDLLGLDADIDEGLFVRTDHLLAPHQEMARLDLASPPTRGRVLELIEEQLALLTERQAAVEARLQQIRSVIFRRYREGVEAQDRPA